MKIFYLTTAQDSESFATNLSKWSVSPNLSNQNFHNKLIRAIALTHDVNVISVRPINRYFAEKSMQKSIKIENRVIWNYIKVSASKVDKLLFASKRIDNVIRGIEQNDILFVDTLNLSLIKQAVHIKNKHGCKLIGICTDSPYNISFLTESYKDNLLSYGRKMDCYVCLTPKINELYNPNKKPFILIDGITEPNNSYGPFDDLKIVGNYIFFGGSLMRKYGVYNLIEAYNNINPANIKLIICGHHEEQDLKEAIEGKNILYLGGLPYEKVCYLEKHSLCAVNPRPIDPTIDDYSIPSKTLEYLANGTITITVKNNLLYERYGKAILWSKSGSIEDLENALEKAIDLNEKERESLINNSLQLINKFTSFEAVNKEIQKLF